MYAAFSRVIDWLGKHELVMMLSMIMIVGGIWLFAEIADEVTDGDWQNFDDRVILALRQPGDLGRPIGPEWMHEIGRDLTALGGIVVLTLVTGSVVTFHIMTRKYRAALFIALASFGGFVVGAILKYSFDRPRPQLVPHLSHVTSSSFPSGHSMMAAVIYLTLGASLAGLTQRRRLRVFYMGLAITVTGLVGFSRVYMGVHYPTDVLGGWTAGLVWATICWVVERKLQRQGVVEAKE